MSQGGEVVALMLFVAQEGRCFHCDTEFQGKGEGRRNRRVGLWTRDHVRLRSHGHGPNFNIVLACGTCNHDRGARPPTDAELARAAVIFEKLKVIWRAFYGDHREIWGQPQLPRAPVSP